MEILHNRGRTWPAGVLALILVIGGCTGAPPRQTTQPSAVMSASTGVVGPVLASATAEADLAVDRGLAAALDKEFAAAEYEDLRSMIVLAHGRTVYERYFQSKPTDYHQVFSITKSVIGTLIGIAIADGAIPSVHATLAELLPDHAKQMTPAEAGTTLEQLLTMMGGFNDDVPQPTAPNWVTDILTKQTFDPGSDWYYSSNSAHLAAAALAEATKVPVIDYARAKLFDPLGIPTTPAAKADANDPNDLDGEDFAWSVDPQGINAGGFGLRLRAQDMAKLGLLYLHDGTWAGRQIVPSAWVHRATTKQADNGGGGYGYFWWVDQLDGDPMYAAAGNGGQRIWVIPNRQLVVAYQVWTDPATGHHEQAVAGKVDDAFRSIIAPAFTS